MPSKRILFYQNQQCLQTVNRRRHKDNIIWIHKNWHTNSWNIKSNFLQVISFNRSSIKTGKDRGDKTPPCLTPDRNLKKCEKQFPHFTRPHDQWHIEDFIKGTKSIPSLPLLSSLPTLPPPLSPFPFLQRRSQEFVSRLHSWGLKGRHSRPKAESGEGFLEGFSEPPPKVRQRAPSPPARRPWERRKLQETEMKSALVKIE